MPEEAESNSEDRAVQVAEAVALLGDKSADEIVTILASIIKAGFDSGNDWLIDIYSQALRILQDSGSATIIEAGKLMAVHPNGEVRKEAYWWLEVEITTSLEVRELLSNLLNDEDEDVASWYDDVLTDFVQGRPMSFTIGIELAHRIAKGRTRENH